VTAGIPTKLLIVAQQFGAKMSADRVARAVAEGALAAGMAEPELCPLPNDGDDVEIGATLGACDFDARMKASRAIAIVTKRLDEHTLLGSFAFEVATRARQSGVPAYAVTAEDAISQFDARILDLQVVLVARGERSLQAAGAQLAEIA
jgi:glycerate kinase